MKLLGFALPASIPTIIFVGHALSACGGSSSAPLTSGGNGNGNGNGNDNGQDATTGGNNDDASSGNPGSQDASKPTDSSITIPDGGFVLPPVEAGALGSILPGAPGTIECGQIDCAVTSNTCCANTDGGTSCVAGTTTTCPQGTLHCAQAADCPSGQLCCATFKDTGGRFRPRRAAKRALAAPTRSSSRVRSCARRGPPSVPLDRRARSRAAKARPCSCAVFSPTRASST
jgi:hypothetical protein